MTVFAFEWTSTTIGVSVVVVLLALLLVPYLIKEIADGKKELGRQRKPGPDGRVIAGPTTPTGIGDNTPGRPGNPAPGQPDAQADPYSPRAQRGGSPIQS